MVGLVERRIVGVILGGRGLGLLGGRKFREVEVINVEVCPDRSMVAAYPPEVLIGGAVGRRCEISKGEDVVNVAGWKVCFVSRVERRL